MGTSGNSSLLACVSADEIFFKSLCFCEIFRVWVGCQALAPGTAHCSAARGCCGGLWGAELTGQWAGARPCGVTPPFCPPLVPAPGIPLGPAVPIPAASEDKAMGILALPHHSCGRHRGQRRREGDTVRGGFAGLHPVPRVLHQQPSVAQMRAKMMLSQVAALCENP